MNSNELIKKIKELREMMKLISEAEAEAEALKDELKAYMGDAEEIFIGEYKLTYKPVTSSRIDTAALKKTLPDVATAFTKTTTTRRFCIG